MPSERIFLAMGSNVGDRMANITTALRLLREKMTIQKVSSTYTSQPMYLLEQPEFYNLVIEITTTLQPEELLQFCKQVEQAVGRVQRERNGPREIDIDILLYGDRVVSHPDLQIPHQRIAERPFVVVPLVEIAPEYSHFLEELGDFEPLSKNTSGILPSTHEKLVC
ncbi:MAG: 2-amino-4-hydroxy-6-hydroxymethyldihydropteridine diphosphokinase [bacterium]|nr:2-amino-4-hydroxy-6-hydroxymethyldihydropteridine diphosphokinase [bacterium]